MKEFDSVTHIEALYDEYKAERPSLFATGKQIMKTEIKKKPVIEKKSEPKREPEFRRETQFQDSKQTINDPEYLWACKKISTENGRVQFPSSGSSFFGDKFSNFVGNPVKLGDAMMLDLGGEICVKYRAMRAQEEMTNDPKVQLQMSHLLDKATSDIHEKYYPNSPICQWHLESYVSPQLYWAIKAANQDYTPALVEEGKLLGRRAKDNVYYPELQKAIELKLAYEGNSEMQYALYKRFHYDPNVENMFNGPAVNKAEKDEAKAEFWLKKLSENENLKLDWWILELVSKYRTPQVEAAMRKAANTNQTDLYKIVAEYFGENTEIGFELYKKDSYVEGFSRSSSCGKVINRYMTLGNRGECIAYLREWINSFKNKGLGDAYSVYKENYPVFRWINDADFNMWFLDCILNSSSTDFTKQEVWAIKKEKFKTLLFGNNITRR